MIKQGINIEGIMEPSTLTSLKLQESSIYTLEGQYRFKEGIEKILNVMLYTSLQEPKYLKAENRQIIIATCVTEINMLILEKGGGIQPYTEIKTKEISVIVPLLEYLLTPYIVDATLYKQDDYTVNYSIHQLCHIDWKATYESHTLKPEIREGMDLTRMFL